MNEINLLITCLIGAVGTLLWFLITKQIKRIEDDILERKADLHEVKMEIHKEIDLLWSEMKKFQINYLDRFEKVNSNINASRETLCDMIHQLDKKIK